MEWVRTGEEWRAEAGAAQLAQNIISESLEIMSVFLFSYFNVKYISFHLLPRSFDARRITENVEPGVLNEH